MLFPLTTTPDSNPFHSRISQIAGGCPKGFHLGWEDLQFGLKGRCSSLQERGWGLKRSPNILFLNLNFFSEFRVDAYDLYMGRYWDAAILWCTNLDGTIHNKILSYISRWLKRNQSLIQIQTCCNYIVLNYKLATFGPI